MTDKKRIGRPPIPDKQVVIVRVDGPTHNLVMKLARRTGLSMSEIIRRALRRVVESPESFFLK